ncbi:tape measure protein [Oscillibacter sp.]|uniref:tape measure protein n=1 Tax=Oscillibacter sp. TaxID=1945593 RepID=UPI00262AC796|nr:tape measure protein [Oscillibacter sp.]MDD3347334.1 tape measure protein [Oscillibacter sp.]
MATLRTAIALYDGMTAPLQSMNRAMGIVLNSFEKMQAVSGNAVDTESIQQARVELAKAETAFDGIDESIRRSQQNQNNFNNAIRNGGSAADDLWNKIKGIAISIGGVMGLQKVLNISDQLTQGTARLNLIVDDGGSVDALEAKIYASAQRSRANYLDMIQSVSKLGVNAADAFANNDELIQFAEQVQKNFTIAGTSTAEASAAFLQLTQAMASGVLRGDELRSVFEQAPTLIQAVSKYLDVPIGQIRDMAAEGQITAEIVKNAILAATDETNAKFDAMPKTWDQIWTSMKNQALLAFQPILQKLNEVGNSERFQQMVNGLINGLYTLAAVATAVFDGLVSAAAWVSDNWSILEPIVWALVAAFVAYNVVGAIVSLINGAVALSEGVKASAQALATGATFAETAAQYGLNAALLACPLTWIVLLIIALIAVIYAVCAAIAKFTGVATSGFGVICGGVNVVIAFFKNLGLSVANIALGIWNALSACASNIGTAFHNVISGVQSWFYNLLSTALTVVAGICEALNKLPFVEFDYSGITNAASDYAAKSAAASGNMEDYTSVADAFNKGMNTFDTYQSGWASDAFSAGAAWGDGVANKVSGLFSGANDALGAYDLGNAANATAANTGTTADNTGKSLDIAEDSLEYLNDIAEREAINRFTTAEVTIHQTNENHINSELDLDGIMDGLATKMVEEVDVSAEGVHD